jgi:hypothetical protein
MKLREMLLKDFDKDLPISGGFGQSADDPIILTSKNPMEAATTQLEVARCVYGINGWYWRAIERLPVEGPMGRVEKLTSEVKYAEGDQIITEKRSFYFDLSEVDLPMAEALPGARVPLGHPAQLGLPWQLGWFHFDGLINNEEMSPGLGLSVAYSAPMAKMTIYAYDKEMSKSILDDPDGSALAEYHQAISDFESMNPSATVMREHEEAGTRLKLYESGDTLSAVLVAPFRNFFFKLRLTLEASNEPFMVDCAWFTIATFGSMVGKRDKND